ncbi:putative hemolysin [Sphingomonas jejuensis]|uniref:Hemolysin n=1 Tax=Sphingomonas jejuensis TaxID=904715 RepID=A0ABX0XMF4_9SPHN|nr:hemolysin family protein [Sphingomonas jejuensis]NJC34557.1 putative hemolysin [Sphingomonas jejuensis]
MQPLPPFPWLDLLIIVALIGVNGLFAMSELALVSSRRPRLQALDKAGSRGARVALTLSEDPGRFLSTVQIGITLIGILAGAYSGSSLGGPVAARLERLGLPADTAEGAGFGVVIAVTTYLSLIVGELVPKQIALRSPERIAAAMAIPMSWLARVAGPIVWLLDASTGLVFRLLGIGRENDSQVTAEELHLIVAEASKSGVIEEHERAIISGVVRLADRPVREVMTPRTIVDWIDVEATPEDIRAALAGTGHTRLPVAEGSVDRIVGVIQARDIATALVDGRPLEPRALMRPVTHIPDQLGAMEALETLRRAEVPMVLIQDEYGHFEGLVTPTDLLIAIAGSFASDVDDATDPDVVEREDGSLLVSGSLSADALAERLELTLPDDRDYATAAGFALSVLKRLPKTGDHFTAQGWRFEIVDMDGRKIDKLLAEPVVDPAV